MILVTAYTDFELRKGSALRRCGLCRKTHYHRSSKGGEKAVWQYETEKKEQKGQISEREYQNIQGYVLESLLLSKALECPEDIAGTLWTERQKLLRLQP